MTEAPSTLVRPERPADEAAVRAVNVAAFGRPGTETDEADLVDAIRRNGNVIVSLVAEREGEVVGHALFSPLTITAEDGSTWTHPALGPLAVLPEHQRRGVGSALMRAGIEACRDRGYGAVFLLGHVSYYPRFGFQPARPLGIVYDDGRDSFMVLELQPGALAGVSGRARFSPEFDAFS